MTTALNPTATKPIPPKTEAKLGEASRYLMRMEVTRESYEDFGWLVANFLTATRSVKDILKKELASGDKVKDKRIGSLIEAKMRADPEMDKLVKARNAHVHDGNFKLDVEFLPESYPGLSPDPGVNDFWRRYRLGQLKSREVGRQYSQSRIMSMSQPVVQVPRAFFDGIRDRDAYTVCAGHLQKVRDAAQHCVQLYG